MSRKLYLALTSVLALAGSPAYALGVGGLRLQSALNQPFVGEIELLDVKPDELDAIKVQVAPQAEFNRTGTERYHYLAKLRFSPQLSPRGGPVIRVTSRDPIREPYMDFLVEVVWPKGRLVKQFTLLLDPPVTSPRSAPRIEQAVADVRPSPATASEPSPPAVRPRKGPPPSEPPPVQTPRRAAPAPTPDLPRGNFPKRLGPVRTGTGLWRLARGHTPPGATVSQTAMALYRSNPDAFINGDINRLIAGRTLTLPSAGELFALNPDAASREFRAAMKGEKVSRGPLIDPSAPGSPTLVDGSRLKIAGAAEAGGSRAPTGGAVAGNVSAGGGLEQDLLLVREANESTRQETVEMRGRIRDLESQLSEIQKLLQLRNAELARAQVAGGGASNALIAANTAAQGSGPTVAPRAADGTPTPGAEVAPSAPEAPSDPLAQAALLAGGSVGEPPLIRAVAPDPGVLAAAQVAQGVAAPVTGPGAVLAPPTPPRKPPTPVADDDRLDKPAAAAPAKDADGGDSTWRALLLPLAGVAAVTALGIGALMWMRSRRRVGADSTVEYDSTDTAEDRVIKSARTALASPPSPDFGSVVGDSAGSAGGVSELPGAVEAPSSAFASFGRTGTATDEGDVISEADIYIAYGRYREAEELLRDEIRHSPDRLDLKFKLAEAYYGAKNVEALRGLMEDVRTVGADQTYPDQWQRLVDMTAAASPGATPDGPVAAPVRVPPVRMPPQVGRAAPPVGSSHLTDAGSGEVYSLDILDARNPSADLSLRSPLRPSEELGPVRTPGTGRASGSGWAVPDTAGLQPLSLDHPFFAGGEFDPGVDAGGGRLDELVIDADDQRFSRGVSDLELTIDELRSSSPFDVGSYVETTRTLSLSDDLTLPPIESPASSPEPVTPSDRSPVGVVVPAKAPLPGPVRAMEDNPSSDQLSPQWQTDSGLWDETATKLELARAYVEMGDKDAARGILDEVVGEGSEEQRGEAREMLLHLG
ncbi:MAG TPA: FimV/HubP family polar landmark protein [Lamprocystis sp. (in: g-proteobacteria)]|nr:FimV/HubP family polar landmark protein [Lamprocystis sp. (in: g-proteobacteria)]